MAYQEVRDENGKLVCRYNPETREVEVKQKGEKRPLYGNLRDFHEREKETARVGRN